MDTRRVYIVWSNPLFRDTIRLLLNHPMLEIVGTGSQLDVVLNDIERTKPEIIIVEQTEDNSVTQIDAMKILKACPWEARVIRLSLEDNELWVYHHQRQIINATEDFLRIVQDD